MRLIDRESELKQIKRLSHNPPSLIVVRGRRRVGKSFLLSEAFKDARALNFQADESNEMAQLETFASQAVRQLGLAGGLSFSNWDQALEYIQFEAKREKLSLVIDEFQYLCAAQPALPSIIQRHWDRWQRQKVPICIVICGSALSFMDQLLAHSSPLYGRADYLPVVDPFDFRLAAEFAQRRYPPARLVERYGILGGTPQYQVWAGGASIPKILQDSVLSRGSPLYEEPLNLIRQEQGIRDVGKYFSALDAIAKGRTKTGEIAGTLGLSASRTYRLLEKLSSLKYVELRQPLEPKQKTARAYWEISDPYFRFWFRYVFPNRSRLEAYQLNPVLKLIDEDLSTYTGHIFEQCCRQWVRRYSDDAAVGASKHVGLWWSRDGMTEVDVVGCDDSSYTLLGSCKWSGSVSVSALNQLYEAKALLGKRAAQAKLMVFGKDSFTDTLQQRAENEGVRLVSARDLFS